MNRKAKPIKNSPQDFRLLLPENISGMHKAMMGRENTDVDFKSEEGDDPCCDRRTDVGSHDDADGLGKCQKSCINETDNHHSCGTWKIG